MNQMNFSDESTLLSGLSNMLCESANGPIEIYSSIDEDTPLSLDDITPIDGTINDAASFLKQQRFEKTHSVTVQRIQSRKINGKLHGGIKLKGDSGNLCQADRDLVKVSSLFHSQQTRHRNINELNGRFISTSQSVEATASEFLPSLYSPPRSAERAKTPNGLSRGLANRPYSAMDDELKDDVSDECSSKMFPTDPMSVSVLKLNVPMISGLEGIDEV